MQLSVALRNRVCLSKLCYLNTSEELKPQDVIYMTTFLEDCTSKNAAGAHFGLSCLLLIACSLIMSTVPSVVFYCFNLNTLFQSACLLKSPQIFWNIN